MYKLNPANMTAMYQWVRRHAQVPFFLLWHHFEVHDPYLCTDFLAETLPAKNAAEVRDHLEELKRSVESLTPGINRHRLNNEELQDFLRQHQAFTPAVCRALYEGGVRSADLWLGAMIRTLRDLRLYDQSLIILTSDHGEEFADHYADKFFGGHGHSLYDELIRTPLIIKLPGQRHAGARVKGMVRNIDVMPTILDVLQINQAAEQMQGSSLRPFWEDEDFTDDRLAVSEALIDLDEKKSVRTGQYKLVFAIAPRVVSQRGRAYMPRQATRLELYDVLADPRERVNLLETTDREEYARLIQSMEEYMRRVIAHPSFPVETTTLEQETIEALRAMGYIENEPSRLEKD